MSSDVAPDRHALAIGALHLSAGKYFQLAGFMVLVYDHILTFSDEVEHIWQRKFTGASILFLINRYITPLQFIIIIDAFQDPRWTSTACNRYVTFEGASTAALVAVCELIMILRVYALYGRSTYVLSFLMFLWVAQVLIASIGVSTGIAVRLPHGLIGCILTGKNKLFASLWAAPLVTDTCIFFLTLWRIRDYLGQWRFRNNTSATLVFFRDGLLYFLVIFTVNLLNTLVYFLVADDLKAIGASFSQLVTATMISRLVLNLRSSPSASEGLETIPNAPIQFMSRTVGHLGGELENVLDHKHPRLPQRIFSR